MPHHVKFTHRPEGRPRSLKNRDLIQCCRCPAPAVWFEPEERAIKLFGSQVMKTRETLNYCDSCYANK